MKLKVKKLQPLAQIPKAQKVGDVGLDLTCISKIYDKSSSTYIYGFGISIELEPGYFGLIVPRSSIYKKSQVLTNHCGIIDENYRGELKAIFRDSNPNVFSYDRYEIGDRIAQLIVLPYPNVEIEEVSELSESNRGSQGFGSSNK